MFKHGETMSKKTTVTIYVEDLARFSKHRQHRKIIPEKKPGRGRGPDTMETNADLFKRIIDAYEDKEDSL